MDIRLLTDRELIVKLKTLVKQERESLVEILACLAEVERRRLHADEGYTTLFAYCVGELRYSDGAAARRMHSARAANKFPEIYSLLADGSISLSAVSILAAHLNAENHTEVLSKAQGKTKGDIEKIISTLAPKPDISDRMRSIPTNISMEFAPSRMKEENPCASEPSACSTPAGIEKMLFLAPQRVQFSFTGSEDLRTQVERMRELLRRKHPAGKLEDLFREAVTAFLDQHDPERTLRRKKPRIPASAEPSFSRRVPQWVKDQIWKRDEGRCTFVSPAGRRCGERGRLEFDHIQPWARGGSNNPDNIRLLCRAHNQLRARQAFGEAACGPRLKS